MILGWTRCRLALRDRSRFPDPLAAELRRGIGPLLPEILHIRIEHHSLSYTNICLCLDSLQALSHVSAETRRQGNVKHTNVHLASWNDTAADETVRLVLFVFPVRTPALTKCCFYHFRLIPALPLCLKVDTLIQKRFDKHLESHIFGQAPFVSGQASPSEVFLKGICFIQHSISFSARCRPRLCFPQL